jgi:hypothetical protein
MRVRLRPRVLSQSRSFFRFALMAIVLMLFAGAASAYTIVLRDGRRIEVSDFQITQTTFTYEVAPGINKTLQLNLIDIAATERANNESPGSFRQHATRISNPSPQPPVQRHAQQTLTNRDLEPIRLRRIESEKNYEKRRIELGLPSLEETRRRQAEEDAELFALARRREIDDADNEAYWRQRAGALRNEIAAIDGEINYWSSQRGVAPFVANTTIPFVSLPNPPGLRPQRGSGQGTMLAPAAGSPNSNLVNTGVAPLRSRGRNRPLINSGRVRQFGFVGLYQPNGASDELNNLWARRAVLEALWRELEDEARRAHVPQIWLQP